MAILYLMMYGVINDMKSGRVLWIGCVLGVLSTNVLRADNEWAFFDTLNVRGIFSGRISTNEEKDDMFGQCTSLSKATKADIEAFNKRSDILLNPESLSDKDKEVLKYMLASCGKDLGSNFNFGVEIFTNIIRPITDVGFVANVGLGYIHETIYNRELCYDRILSLMGLTKEIWDKTMIALSLSPKNKITANTFFLFLNYGCKFNFGGDFALDITVDTRLGYRIASLKSQKKSGNSWSEELETVDDKNWNSENGVKKFYFDGGLHSGFDCFGVTFGVGVGLTRLSYCEMAKSVEGGKKSSKDSKDDKTIISLNYVLDAGYDVGRLIKDNEGYDD